MHEWMPRLAAEGVVGADAIFACLGPALEVFSKYSCVEKASGEAVTLREYLEQVWAAVAREALSLMFEGADASGLEADARVTAMWLWTLGAGASGSPSAAFDNDDGEDAEEEGQDDAESGNSKAASGFVLDFDAARKIAQGLGAHLEKLPNVVEVKGDKARLLTAGERAKALFSKTPAATDGAPMKGKKKGPSKKQLGLFAEVEAAKTEGLLGKHGVPRIGETTLDRLHQSMILFGAGRSEALKRFVTEDSVGRDPRFWRLAQSLSALYPAGSDEKRWVDGVLARKKSLGF
jgi:putative DNA methylase